MEKRSRPCPVCGTQNAKNATVCQKCGVELTPETDADVLVFDPKGRAGSGAPRACFLKKVAKPVWAAVIVAIIGAAVLLAFRGVESSAHSPEKTAAEFRSAMAAGDFEELQKIARPSDSAVAFTAETAQPMFALYQASPAFRRSVDTLASGGSTVFHLQPERHFLYTGYTVSIDTVELTVHTNIAAATVASGDRSALSAARETAEPVLDGTSYPSDYANLVRSDATLSGLLPGVYDVTANYDASFGGHFTSDASVQLANSRELALNFDYTSVYLWNTSDMDVQIAVGDSSYGTLGSNMTLQLAPVHPSDTITASCQPASGDAMTSSITASDGYFEIHFALGRVEIYNDYDAQMNVSWGGKPYCAISAKSTYIIASAPVGTVLTCTLEGYDIFAPYVYTVAYDYDSICPIFDLSDTSSESVSAAIGDYLASLGPEAPETPTDLSNGLQELFAATGLTGSELAVSNIAIDEVFDVELSGKSVLLHLNGSYEYTLPAGMTLLQEPTPDAPSDTPAAPDVQPTPDAPADSGESGDAAGTQEPSVQTNFTQRFNATILYDGASWTVQG